MSLTAKNIVILKSTIDVYVEGFPYMAGRAYRCIYNEVDGTYIINGYCYTKKEFNKHFQYMYQIIMDEFLSLGLVKADNNPITKKAFFELLDIHTYGGGANKNYIGFVYKNPKDVIYGFYASYYASTKVEFKKEIYSNYLELVNGSMDNIDYQIIQRGNSGIPIGYRSLRYREVKNNELIF